MSSSNKDQLIGLLGGTFDPVHNGHLEVARQALTALELDRVIFIPAADPPHKKKTGAAYRHRVAMLEAALAPVKGTHFEHRFEISLLEAERATPSYTIDTLLELKKRLGGQTFYFIIGADSLLELPLWYRYQELPALTHFIVAARPGISLQSVQQAIAALPGPFVPDLSGGRWSRSDGAEIFYLADVATDISSSAIRRQISQGQRPDSVNRQVLAYIVEHDLYLRAADCAQDSWSK